MFCQKCGKLISDDEYYCPFCGKEMPKKKNLITKPKELTIWDCFKNFIVKGFSGDGIATRKEFWVVYICFMIQNVLLGVLGVNYINTILNIILFLPILGLTVRRFHDIDMSGAWACLGGYAEIGYMFSFFFENKTTSLILLITAIIALVIQLLILSKPTNKKSRWNPINGYM